MIAAQPKDSGLNTRPNQDYALVFINPKAGTCDPVETRRLLAETFDAAGWRYDVRDCGSADELASAIADARSHGLSLVVAAGGDGTVASVANQLVGTDLPLGILPLGTGNILARELGIPVDQALAAALLAGEHESVAVDAIRIGQTHYFLDAEVGLGAIVMRDTGTEEKKLLGLLAYLRTLAIKLFGYRSDDFTVTVDGQVRRVRADGVFVVNGGIPPSNGQQLPDSRSSDQRLTRTVAENGTRSTAAKSSPNGGSTLAELSGPGIQNPPMFALPPWMALPPWATLPADLNFLPEWVSAISPSDGELDLVAWRALGPNGYLRLAWDFFVGVERSPILWHQRVHRHASISATHNLPVQADGEVIGERELVLEAVPAAIRVIVPVGNAPDDQGARSTPEEQLRQARQREAKLARQLGPIGALDTEAYLVLAGLPHPPVVNQAMRFISAVMSKGIGWAVGLVIVALLDRAPGERPRWQAVREIVPAIWLTGTVIELPIKRAFGRARPFRALALSPVVGAKPTGYSFPSAHSAVAFAAARLIGEAYPGSRAAVFALATLVGFSRLYLGVHYLSDVVFGAFSGLLLAPVSRLVVRYLVRLAKRQPKQRHRPNPDDHRSDQAVRPSGD